MVQINEANGEEVKAAYLIDNKVSAPRPRS